MPNVTSNRVGIDRFVSHSAILSPLFFQVPVRPHDLSCDILTVLSGWNAHSLPQCMPVGLGNLSYLSLLQHDGYFLKQQRQIIGITEWPKLCPEFLVATHSPEIAQEAIF